MTENSPVTVNDILDKNRDQHELVLLIAFNKNGKIHIDTNRPTFEFVNYAVNRAMYNINHLETANVLELERQAEANVAALVEQNTSVPQVPKKRGRPKKSV